ncbi:MAG: AAA family ATPase [Gaiellaceae bacterium]
MLRTKAIVGREAEVAAIAKFLAAEPGGVNSLVLDGTAGIGKTTLWRCGVDWARQHGFRVLVARPGAAEVGYAFAALGDLFADVVDEVSGRLPPPQQRALRVALSLEDMGEEPVEQRLVGMGVLAGLQQLAAAAPLVVAVDDLQWLDTESAAVLSFACRRLEAGPVRFLVTRRSGGARCPAVELPEPSAVVSVGGLSIGAFQRLLAGRPGVDLGRQALRRLWQTSAGNPFYGLELARLLNERETGSALEPSMPLPADLASVLHERLARLNGETRELLLTAALLAEPTLPLLQQAAGVSAWERLQAALHAEVVEIEGMRVRFTHPLLASAVIEDSDPLRRRALHRMLAGLVTVPEERARHLALSHDPPDSEAATALEEASAIAAGRGATHVAAELAREAVRFTDPADRSRVRRLLASCDLALRIGAFSEVAPRLEQELPRLPAGSDRALALYLLARSRYGASKRDDLMVEALSEAGEDRALRALILSERMSYRVSVLVTGVEEAGCDLREAVELAMTVGDPVLEDRCRGNLAWVEAVLGHELEGQSPRAGRGGGALWDDIDRVRAVQKLWRGEVEEARAVLLALHHRSVEIGEEWSQLMFSLHLFELETRRGGFAAAERYAELEAAAAGLEDARPVMHRCSALLAAARGDRNAADDAAAELVGSVDVWQRLEATRARGLAALAVGAPEDAVEHLRAVDEAVTGAGFRDPGAFPVAPDLIEALVMLGRDGEAEQALVRLEQAAAEQSHPWAGVVAARCRGLLGRDEAALRRALADHEHLSLPFEQARTLLALGQRQRRRRERAEARTTLTAAQEAFERIGAPPWAERARSELATIGGRKSSGAALTPAEHRVAALIAEGRTNKQAAAELFLSVNTIDSTLRRVYAKLGLRSRAELARRYTPA